MESTFLAKLVDVLKSSSFKEAIFTIILGLVTLNGITLSADPAELWDVFSGQSLGTVVALIISNFLTPAISLIKKIQMKTFDISLLWKDSNIITQWGSVLTLIISGVIGQATGGIIVVLIAQVINLIKHLLEPPTPPTVGTGDGVTLL